MARNHDRPKTYELARTFSLECVFSDGSLLWPGRDVWTLKNLDELWEAYILNPDESDKSFIDKWSDQLSGRDKTIYRLATEAVAIYSLFPSRTHPSTKLNLINDVRKLGPDLGEMNDERLSLLIGAYEEGGIGLTGPDYNTKRPFHVAYYLAFATEIKRRQITSITDTDPVELADSVLDWASSIMGFTPTGSRNAILHLIWPDEFEDSSSDNHKRLMAANLSDHYDLVPLENDDATILQARRHMELKGFLSQDASLYDDEIRQLWDIATPSKKQSKRSKPEHTRDEIPITNNESEGENTPSTIADLADATFLNESHLREIESLLHEKKQLIFEGPPGSGKTFVAEKFARYITGQPLDDSERNEQVEIIQFHQSYSYEDFVEGIRPETNEDGQLVYDVKKGIFREFADKAVLNPGKKFVLIIDEINRGNVSRILGELMLLLEYRNQTATLQYSQDALQIPPNLYIIGTMNTADRSLSQIDYALRRRFYFVRFMSVESGDAPVLRGWLDARGIDHVGPVALFVRLNQRIRQHMHTDDLQVGHSYFMREDIENPQVLNQVWNYAVMPLLREYFYHQRDRDSLLVGFELAQLNAQPGDDSIDPDIGAIDSDDV